MEFFSTQEFGITEPPGVNTVAFVVNYTDANRWADVPVATLEKLESRITEENGMIKKIFSITSETKEVKNVIIVSIAKSRCVIGYGNVKDNQFIADEGTIHLEYTNITDVEEEFIDYKFKFNPKRQIIIIDVDRAEPIKPAVTRKDDVIIGHYNLVPYKNYIAMELMIRPNTKKEKINYEEMANIMI